MAYSTVQNLKSKILAFIDGLVYDLEELKRIEQQMNRILELDKKFVPTILDSVTSLKVSARMKKVNLLRKVRFNNIKQAMNHGFSRFYREFYDEYTIFDIQNFDRELRYEFVGILNNANSTCKKMFITFFENMRKSTEDLLNFAHEVLYYLDNVQPEPEFVIDK